MRDQNSAQEVIRDKVYFKTKKRKEIVLNAYGVKISILRIKKIIKEMNTWTENIIITYLEKNEVAGKEDPRSPKNGGSASFTDLKRLSKFVFWHKIDFAVSRNFSHDDKTKQKIIDYLDML